MKKRISFLLALAMLFSMTVMPHANAEDALTAVLKAYNSDGQLVQSASSLTSISGSLEISGTTDKTISGAVAVYSDDGQLLAVDYETPGTVPATVTYSFTGLPGTAGQTIKAFVWDENQNSVANAVWYTENYYVYAKGILEEGNILYSAYDESVISEDDIASYEWLKETDDGEYKVVGNESTYETPYIQANTGEWVHGSYYYKLKITLKDGTAYESKPVRVEGMVIWQKTPSVWASSGSPKNFDETNPAYKFDVDGHELILLDVMENSDNARFKVLTESLYGPYGFNDGNNVNCDWANSARLLNEGIGKVLPESILSHMASNVRYEGSRHGFGGLCDAGFTSAWLLSWEEMDEYYDIVGKTAYVHGTETAGNWLLRNSAANTSNPFRMYTILTSGAVGERFMGGAYSRPLFYLDKDFFIEEPVDLSKAGAEVISLLKKNYTRAELLAAGYSEEELSIYFDDSVQITNVAISGNMEIGGEYTVTASVSGNETAASKVLYRWELTAGDTYETVGFGTNYTLSVDDNGKSLRAVAVAPNGSEIASDAVLITGLVDSEYNGAIENLEIRGLFTEGNTLYYKYDSVGETAVTDEDIVAYEWYQSATSPVSYALVGTDSSYKTPAPVQGEFYNTAKYNDRKSPDYLYKVRVCLKDGTWYEAPAVTVAGQTSTRRNLGAFTLSNADYSNEDYMFNVDGHDFLLLETFETSDNARYRVLAENTYGLFKETNPADVLPASVVENVADNVRYAASRDEWEGIKYDVTGTFAKISSTEMEQYKDIVGILAKKYGTDTLVQWELRDVSGRQGCNGWKVFGIKTDGTLIETGNGDSEYRPMFHVNKDFFKNVVIDLSKTGINVINHIKETCTRDELLAAGYNEEILSIYFDDSVQITSVEIVGDQAMDAELAPDITADGTEAAIAAVKYRWENADAADGAYTVVGRDNLYKLSLDDHGKYLRVVAIAPNGATVTSAPVLINIVDETYTGKIENLEVRGVFSEGNYLRFGYDVVDGTTVSDEDIIAYRWYQSTTAEGTYELCGTEAKFDTTQPTSNDSYNTPSFFYKLQICLKDGTWYESSPIQIQGRNAAGPKFPSNEWIPVNIRRSNPEYMFNVDGHDFVLLDVIENADTARFLVAAEDTYGKYSSYEALYTALETQFPAGIINHMDKEAHFPTFMNDYGVIFDLGHIPVAVPSTKDMDKYSEILGWEVYSHGTTTPIGQMLRNNSRFRGNAGHVYGLSNVGVPTQGDLNMAELRPMFYLSSDFFKNVPIDIENAGGAVKDMLRSQYTRDELIANYGDETLKLFYDEGAVVIDGVFLDGTPALGAVLTADCDYYDTIEGAAKYITYKWQVSDTADGVFETIATGISFEPTLDYDGMYLRVTATGPDGNSAVSDAVLMNLIDESFTGTVSNQHIKGILSSGHMLHLAYDSDTVTDEDILLYKWYKSTSANGTFELYSTDKSPKTEAAEGVDKRYYKLVFTLKNGVEYETPVVEVEKTVRERVNATNQQWVPTNPVVTDSEYKFLVDDQEFILLDSFETSDTSRYLVMAENTYGVVNYGAFSDNLSAISAKIDADITPLLPETVRNHIDYNAYWRGCENAWGGYHNAGYAGVMLPSASEMQKYSSIIGLQAFNYKTAQDKNAVPVSYATRQNACYTGDGRWIWRLIASADESGNYTFTSGTGHLNDVEIRPIFYVDKDFFEEESVIYEDFFGDAALEMIGKK